VGTIGAGRSALIAWLTPKLTPIGDQFRSTPVDPGGVIRIQSGVSELGIHGFDSLSRHSVSVAVEPISVSLG